MRRIFLCVIAIFILFGDSLTAKPASKSGYDWISHARIFILDAYTYPFFPKIEFDAEKMAETMVDMHANTVRIATSGSCNWLIPGTEFTTAPDLGDRDILAECVAACKPRGIKVVPYLRTGGSIPTIIMKPEWAQRANPAGDIRSSWDLGTKFSTLCWNTPYREAFYDLVEKIVSRYDIDGMYFDSWALFYSFTRQKGYSVCYCAGCRKGFKDATDLDLPFRSNENDYTSDELAVFKSYRDWYMEELVEIFKETKRLIKSYKDIPLIYNINNPTRIKGADKRILNGSDAFLYERGRSMLERAEGTSLAVAHGLAVWPYVGVYDGYPRIVHYKYELQQEIYTTVAFGGSPILYHTYFYVNYPKGREPIKEAFRVFDENSRYIENFHPYKYCAVVWNDTDPPGHAVDAWLWETNARFSTLGAFAACIYNHIQTTSLLKDDLDNPEVLSGYKVLYLPDICYISDTQAENIKNFVKNGGGLVMTYATSLYDENGKKRSDFSLGELAKIQYLKPDKKMSEKMAENLAFGGVWDLYMKTRDDQFVIEAPLTEDLIPTHLYETVKPLPGGTVAADIVVGTDNEPIFPGLIVSGYGKGKVAYIPSALGAIYLETHIQEFADFLKDVISYVSPDALPYEIDAPSSLIANMTINSNKRVLHLINWTGCKLERVLQNVYHIPPIEDVLVKYKIPNGKSIKNIKLFIPAEFSHFIEEDILNIKLPRIEKYQGIVIEMK
ncbi:beta-galactosidase trimerization domain-containing protein [candidate division KSB1 bacterium]